MSARLGRWRWASSSSIGTPRRSPGSGARASFTISAATVPCSTAAKEIGMSLSRTPSSATPGRPRARNGSSFTPSHGEDYVEAVLGLIRQFGVRQYTLIGSMYAPVPHTRPPVASGGAASDDLREQVLRAGVKESSYEGPTTILATMPQMASGEGIETASIILQLPAYIQLERDYCGTEALLDILSRAYSLDLDISSLHEESQRQREAMNESVAQNPQLQAMVAELERVYDSEKEGPAEETPELSPELEGFLKDVQTRLDDSS